VFLNDANIVAPLYSGERWTRTPLPRAKRGAPESPTRPTAHLGTFLFSFLPTALRPDRTGFGRGAGSALAVPGFVVLA